MGSGSTGGGCRFHVGIDFGVGVVQKCLEANSFGIYPDRYFFTSIFTRLFSASELKLEVFLDETITGYDAALGGKDYGGSLVEPFEFRFRVPACDVYLGDFNQQWVYQKRPSMAIVLQNDSEVHTDLSWVHIVDLLFAGVRAGEIADWLVVQLSASLARKIDGQFVEGIGLTTAHTHTKTKRSKAPTNHKGPNS